jgi:hypothetical protein
VFAAVTAPPPPATVNALPAVVIVVEFEKVIVPDSEGADRDAPAASRDTFARA